MSPLDSGPSLGAPETPEATSEPNPTRAPLTDPEIHFLNSNETATPQGSLDPRGRTFFQALRRRWRSACSRGLLAAVAMAAASYWALPPRYSARALVQLLPQNSLAASFDGPQEDFTAYRTTQAALFRSRPVLQAALARPQIADLAEVRSSADPLGWLEKKLSVDDAQDSEILTISLSGSHPEDLAAVLNAVIDSYIQETVQQKTALRRDQIEQLQQSYQKYQELVRQKQNELRDREGVPGAAPAPPGPLDRLPAAQRLAEAKQEWRRIQGELETARLELAAAREKQKAGSEAAVPEAALDEYLMQDAAARQHQARLAELDDKIARIERLAAPAVLEQLLERPRQEREVERAALADCRKAARRALAPRYPAKGPAELQATADRLRQRVATLTEQERTLSRQVQKLEESTRPGSALPPGGTVGGAVPRPRPSDDAPRDLIALRADLDRAAAALHKIGERLELFQAEPLTPRAAVLQPALPPQLQDRGKPLVLAALAGSGCFFLVVYARGWREFRSQIVYGLDDLRGPGMGVIGAVPALPLRALRSALSSDLASGPGSGPGSSGAAGNERELYRQSLLMESIDTMRAQLLRVADSTDLRVLMVTSALSGEGKTALACHLAASLARAWRKTLLVDGDLRHPQIHQHFDMPLDPGFSDVLRGQAELDDTIRSTPLSRLCLLPAGQWDSYAVQALAQAEMQRLFESLKEQYDFIVVDSSPVLPVADALSLGQHVDAVLFSVLTDHSRMPAVRGAHRRLDTLGIRVLGAVVQGAREEIGDLQYQYPAKLP